MNVHCVSSTFQPAKVFVGSLPPGCKPEELRHLFTSYGVVVECDIMNRCGFVHLETIEMAEAAISALNGIEFKGQAIVVEPGRPKDRRGGGGGATIGNRRPMQGKEFNLLIVQLSFITKKFSGRWSCRRKL